MSSRDVSVIARMLLLAALSSSAANAQTTSAAISGVVFDQQRAVLRAAAIVLISLDTGAARETSSDDLGAFHLAGLVPGRYELRVTRSGFATAVHAPIALTVGEEARVDPVLRIASLDQAVTVNEARVAGIEPTKTVLGRTFTERNIDALPVPGRDFTTLATLTPGVMPDLNQGGGSSPNLTGFATAGQNGRNNAILVDGLSHDDAAPGAMRGGVSLEAVKEFVVSTNGFAAEHGQASGAVVNVVTRSGTNALSARVFYLHRDDDWDATPGSAKLAIPPVDKAHLEQRIFGGSAGGPLVRNRAFFFGALEHFDRETDHIVTSPLLPVFRPGEDPRLPQRIRNPNLLGRADMKLAPGSSLLVRYRFDDSTGTNRFTEADLRLGTGERAHDLIRRDQDLGIVSTQMIGSSGFNELRVMFGRRFVDLNVDAHCGLDCPAENRPSIRLGKSFNLPQQRTEDRWQVADTFTRLLGGRGGQHTVKAGFDVSFIEDRNYFPLNFAGTFTFTRDLVFDPANPDTYPSQFTNSTGPPNLDLEDEMYAAFVQDQWRASSRLTISAGLRWDYEHAPGISHDRNNVAPRLGISYDLTGSATTVVRGSYGLYYDQVFLNVAREVEQAAGLVLSRIDNPGYPDPRGPNQRRTGSTPLVPSLTRYGDNMKTPLASELTLGVQRELGPRTVLTLDGVWARGRHLLASHDLNYPDLTDPSRRRPDPGFAAITAYETRGNSWYTGLQASVRRQHANGYSYYVAYTLSSSERDTEDFRFFPQDQRNYAGDRGPGVNDSRQRLTADAAVDLPFALHLAGILTARTGLPFNITTGVDSNRDTYFTDRPPDTGRNSGRGDPFWQSDVRISRTFTLQRVRLEILGEVFNLTNHRNWIGPIGDLRSAQFGKPTAAAGAREIQLGVRVEY
jgi:Carboxypeptidase regulatory-like domain/TonB dependent receptor-like, beta-barrel